ncbi:lipoprotein [Mycoplasma putrefaciens]|uniref:Lipoprotein n=1 Tax=Mycoplasma putrefaciens (strain ATCC 15718 / NCTC 10155 / C30 KS-1 / KS-1) TaxID=743965 RepID=A0A7U3ZS69_MYCPK|nr:lipoprotein [Mycoplasma putrefaciens]AEM68528.1 lipoprotein [Mycoplasma putrefaciens KS1]
MKKLLSVLGATGMITSTAIFAVACQKSEPVVIEKKELSSIITVKDLGKDLKDKQDSTIIAKVIEQNPNTSLQEADLQVSDIKESQDKKFTAKISPSEEGKAKFKGEVSVEFKLFDLEANLIDLKEVIKETKVELPKFQWKEEKILERIVRLNHSAKLDKNDLKIEVDKDKMKAKAFPSEQGKSKYKGSVELTLVALSII